MNKKKRLSGNETTVVTWQRASEKHKLYHALKPAGPRPVFVSALCGQSFRWNLELTAEAQPLRANCCRHCQTSLGQSTRARRVEFS